MFSKPNDDVRPERLKKNPLRVIFSFHSELFREMTIRFPPPFRTFITRHKNEGRARHGGNQSARYQQQQRKSLDMKKKGRRHRPHIYKTP